MNPLPHAQKTLHAQNAIHAQNEFRRLARERASEQNQVRMRSVLSVHGALRTGLRTGTIGPEDRLDESVLVRNYSVSRNAVRAALRLLVDEGVVSRAPRAGTVILNSLTDVRIDNGVAWAEEEYADHELITTANRWVPSTPITRRMLRTDSARVYCTEMVDIRGDEVTLLHTRYCLSPGAGRPAITDALERGFEALFAETYGSPIGTIDCWVEAKAADERAAAQLGVAPGTALMVKSRLLWSADGEPREYSVSHYVASRVALTTVHDVSVDEAPVPVPPIGSDRGAAAPLAGHRRSIHDVHSDLRAALRSGLFGVGEQLVEDDLALQFGTSRNTIRAALAQLVDEGLICRNRRQGTVVMNTITDLTIDNGMGWLPEDGDRHRAFNISEATIPTPPIVGERLTSPSPTITVAHYLAYRDDRPFVVYIRYFEPCDRPRPLTSESPEGFDELFLASYGVPVGRIETSIHAVRADERAARMLGVEPGTLLLLKERVLFGTDGRAREFSHSYYVAASVTLSTRSTRAAAGRGALAA
ncbi:GntR family transcriptional regulator [Microbacteriaceae bacterium VKM Ac-2855]|nr:GntR family transcriptional regulator [Microbacteriaceae bacterium VKM Ac-2855]